MSISERTCPNCRASALRSGDDKWHTCECGWSEKPDSTTKLLPCPFCGGEAKMGEGYCLYLAYCAGCRISTQGQETIDGAINLWNTRTPSTLEGGQEGKNND